MSRLSLVRFRPSRSAPDPRGGRSPLVLVGLSLLAGCSASRGPLPGYPLESIDLTLSTLRARAVALSLATGRGTIVLSDPARGSVRLDAAFVLAPPDRARFRAWKFGQAVFDLTVNAEGIWLYAPRDEAGAAGEASRATGAVVRRWLAYVAAGVPADGYSIRGDSGSELLLASDEADGTLLTTIDRRTRTVRSYRVVDSGGAARFTLNLDEYRPFGDTLWPTRITVSNPAGGTIAIETSDLRPGVAAEAAFRAPARAVRLP